ncbi:DUF6612 family protein [Nocardioides montaniterrae]
MTPLRKRAAAAAVSALLITGLSACGGGGSDSSSPFGGSQSGGPSSDGNSAAAPSADGTTAPAVAPGATIAADDFAGLLKDGTSKVSTAHMTMVMDMSASGQQMHLNASGDVQMSPMAVSMTMSMQGMNIKEIMTDGTMYMQLPGATAAGKWMKVDLSKLGSMMGGGMSDAFSNPLGMMDTLSDYITAAKFVGDDSVGGGSAKHYQMTVDMAGAMHKLAPNLPSSASGSIPSTITEDVWLDDQGRPVKTSADMGAMGNMTTTMSDFGKSVHIVAPPASQVQEMPSGSGLGG